MNLKRASVIGIILWVVFFFEVSVLMFGLGLTGGVKYYAIHYTLAAIFLVAASLLYFKKKGSMKEGFLLGLVFSFIGIVLDSVITVPLFVKDYSKFFSIFMLVSYIEGIIITTIVGAVKKGRKK